VLEVGFRGGERTAACAGDVGDTVRRRAGSSSRKHDDCNLVTGRPCRACSCAWHAGPGHTHDLGTSGRLGKSIGSCGAYPMPAP
jgi:hypothetical protein